MNKTKELIKILKQGGVAVIPTDTLYGIVGQALNKKPVKKICNLKKRSPNKSFVILISHLSDLKKFDLQITKQNKDILTKVWPGPVGVIFDCPHQKFNYLHRGVKTIALRLPRSKKLLQILNQTGPLIAPSANLESLPPAKNIAEAKQYFGNKVDFYLPGGTRAGKASTLIKITGNKIEVKRPGKLPKAVLQYLHPATAGQAS